MIEIERARSALWSLDPSCDADSHFRYACGAADAGLTFDDFLEWSKGGSNFKSESDCRSTWKSASKPGAVTKASLYRAALAVGWIDPTKGSDKSSRPNLPPARVEQTRHKPVKQAASGNAVEVWGRCIPATDAEAYIHRKQGKSDGLRVYPASAEPIYFNIENEDKTVTQISAAGGLVVPCYAPDGGLQTLQFITLAGVKRSLARAQFGDSYHTVGTITDCAYIVEGLGTAWAINKATGKAAVVTCGVGRTATVAKALRAKYPAAQLVIVPDKGQEEKAAKIAADVSGQWVAMPDDKPGNYDANDYAQEFGTGALSDLLERPVAPAMRYALLSDADLCKLPPLQWRIKKVLPETGLAAVFGASGSGKSFAVIDMSQAIAAGHKWFGYKSKPCNVVYCALEGEGGIAARKHRRPPARDNHATGGQGQGRGCASRPPAAGACAAADEGDRADGRANPA